MKFLDTHGSVYLTMNSNKYFSTESGYGISFYLSF